MVEHIGRTHLLLKVHLIYRPYSNLSYGQRWMAVVSARRASEVLTRHFDLTRGKQNLFSKKEEKSKKKRKEACWAQAEGAHHCGPCDLECWILIATPICSEKKLYIFY